MVLENNTASSCNEDEMKLANDAKRLKGEEVKNVLCKFEFVKVLNENSANKVVFIQAVCSEGEDKGKDAVIIFEKPHFGLDEVKSFLRVNNESEVDLVNDIYTKLCIYPIRPFNSRTVFYLLGFQCFDSDKIKMFTIFQTFKFNWSFLLMRSILPSTQNKRHSLCMRHLMIGKTLQLSTLMKLHLTSRFLN